MTIVFTATDKSGYFYTFIVIFASADIVHIVSINHNKPTKKPFIYTLHDGIDGFDKWFNITKQQYEFTKQ